LSVTLTPVVTRSGHWRAKIEWSSPHTVPRYFGKFTSQAEAEKWIAAHRWMAAQRQEPDAAEADDPDDPDDPEAANDR
jgi:hypothetical protein